MDKQVIKETLAHWDRMIAFAENFLFDNITFFRHSIKKKTGEFWSANFCPLCKFYINITYGCSNCILYKKYDECSSANDKNRWYSVDKSRTVTEWIENANAFRKQIESLLED